MSYCDKILSPHHDSVVMLNDSKWCWKDPEISTVIVKGSQNEMKFTHTGYKMSYDVSHDTVIVSHSSTAVAISTSSCVDTLY